MNTFPMCFHSSKMLLQSGSLSSPSYLITWLIAQVGIVLW